MKFIKIFSLRIKHSMKAVIILIMSLLGHTYSAYAVGYVCTPAASVPTTTAIINNSTYVGNELPVGSVIYRVNVGSYNNSSYVGITTCQGTDPAISATQGSVSRYFTVIDYPSGASIPMMGGTRVFPTNVSGVGITFVTGSIYAPFSEISKVRDLTVRTGPSTVSTPMSIGTGSYSFDMMLIKTGTITSGATVDANSFPTIQASLEADTPNITGLPSTMWTVNFSGSVNFVTSTCTTPNVNVDMGTHGVAQTFNQPGATTPWIDSSIILQDCPTFTGIYSTRSARQRVEDSGAATGTSRTANLLTVSISPTSSIIDTANGVIEVDAAGSTGAAATGVGLQLGYTPNNINATATSPSTIWKPGMSWDVQPPNDGRASFKIPLAARYYQTSNTVTPGPANARVTFNIDYK